MKKIICTGDSHTWGQGAAGLTDDFKTPLVAGDLRLTNFKANSYVNLLRNYINNLTDSSSIQYSAADKEFFKGKGIIFSDEYIRIEKNGYLSLSMKKGFLRIQCHCSNNGGEFEVLQDGRNVGRFSSYSAESDNSYKILNLNLACNVSVTLQPVNCILEIYKVEIYTGEYAVINSGIGSTPTGDYLKKFWSKYVAPYEPYIVILEAHSINDWINNVESSEYYNNLITMFESIKKMGSKGILLTVSPILGSQIAGNNIYDNYINLSREAALMANVDIADANAVMLNKLFGLAEEEQRQLMFADNWHVNNYGHELYFEVIKNVIMQK